MAANREQRRQMAKSMGLKPGERIELNAIMVQFTDGKAMYLDISKVQIVERGTGEPLFDEVLEGSDDDTREQEQTVVSPEELPEFMNADDATIYQRGDKLPYDLESVDIPEGMELVVKGNFSGLRKKA